MGRPHARGGVSRYDEYRRGVNTSSPRPWGCFIKGSGYLYLTKVFPTPVGVFQRRGQFPRFAGISGSQDQGEKRHETSLPIPSFHGKKLYCGAARMASSPFCPRSSSFFHGRSFRAECILQPKRGIVWCAFIPKVSAARRTGWIRNGCSVPSGPISRP